MRTEINLKGQYILLIPETGLEEQILGQAFPLGEETKCFLKTGLTPAEMVGLKISFVNKNQKLKTEALTKKKGKRCLISTNASEQIDL